jgi:putative glycosyltransferase
MKLSIVATLYHSAPYIEEFYARARRAAEKLTHDIEFIFVNDGSPDDSADIVLRLREQDHRVALVDLSRNFGHHKAIVTGLTFAHGDYIFLIDVDLEEAPELLDTFWTELHARDAHVIYGVREKRQDKGLTRFMASLYWRILNLLADIDIPANPLTARLMKREFVRNFLRFKDQEVFLAGLWVLAGYKQIGIPVEKTYKGKSTYTFRKRVYQMIDSVTSFSTRPLFLIFNLGMFIALAASVSGAYLIFRRIFFDDLLTGWPSLMVAIWFLGGLTLFVLGIIGIYLAKTYSEVKRRPLTVVKSVFMDWEEDTAVLPVPAPEQEKQSSYQSIPIH